MVTTAGPRTGHALTDMQVIEARIAVAEETRTIAQLARRYDVARRTVRNAVTGRLFGHLDSIAAPVQRQQNTVQGTPAGRTRRITVADDVSDADVAALTAFAEQERTAGADLDAIAHDLGVTRTLLCRWLGLPEPRRRRAGGGGSARLTVTMVADLRRRAAAGASIAELSRETGIPDRTLGASIRGRTWRSVTDPPPVRSRPGAHKGAGNPAAKLTAEQVADMRRSVRAGQTLREVAARYGVVPATVGGAVRGGSWPGVDVPPIRQRTFTRTDRDPADKAALIALADEFMRDGCPRVDAARDLGLSKNTLYAWQTQKR